MVDVMAEMPKFPERQPIGSIEDWYKTLMIKDSAILYEDPYVQIGVKADWRGIQGRMVLFLGDKHTGPSTNVRIVILHPSHLRIQSPPVPDTVPPRAQVSTQLKLPLLMNKFLQAVPGPCLQITLLRRGER
ncbi:hypothetical protein KC19_N015700 [Ceratodon purpureus]|nr:hypothetical protein KC19_N015700 [Ceratodon purpureus]